MLTIIAVDIAAALSESMLSGDSRFPVLARFASRGSVHARPVGTVACDAALLPWQVSVLEVLGLADQVCDYPSAPVTRSGELLCPARGFWAHLDPVHLAAGMNDLRGMLLKGAAELTAQERSELAGSLEEHLRAEGLELVQTKCERWLLQFPQVLQAKTMPPEIAFRLPLDRALPEGEHAAQLRRQMTEMQMLIHEHPVNLSRARRNLAPANAVWFWGLGSIADSSGSLETAWPEAFGNEPYLKGLYVLHGKSTEADSFSLAKVHTRNSQPKDQLALVNVPDLDVLELQWLAPLERALREGAIDTLSLHLDRWRITVRRSDLRRFWRRALPPAQWQE